MAISKNDVARVARLSRINLSEEEVELFSSQFESILEFIDKLKQVDVSAVKPLSHVLGMQNVSRADIAQPSLTQEAVLKNAPLQAKGHFQVVKVI